MITKTSAQYIYQTKEPYSLPESKTLFSGADLVNFLGIHQAIGHHKFTSIVKILGEIILRFYNEDGSDYDFVGVDYTAFF